jgi:hypothetical protein
MNDVPKVREMNIIESDIKQKSPLALGAGIFKHS